MSTFAREELESEQGWRHEHEGESKSKSKSESLYMMSKPRIIDSDSLPEDARAHGAARLAVTAGPAMTWDGLRVANVSSDWGAGQAGLSWARARSHD